MDHSTHPKFWDNVDRTGECWTYKGRLTVKGYAHIDHNGGKIMAHRLAYQNAVGPIPAGLYIDHMCHNRACVNPAHLRPVTHKQNTENHSGAYSNNRLGVRGVRRRPDTGKYEARMNHNGQPHYLGLFATVEEANAAVTAKRNELFTHNDLDRKTA